MLENLLRRRAESQTEDRSTLSLSQYAQKFFFDGIGYGFGSDTDSASVAASGPVAAAMAVRVKVFSEITFKWQELRDGRAGKLFGTPALRLLERPWPGASTQHLLAGMEAENSAYGNAYRVNIGGQITRLDPTKVGLILEAVERDGVQFAERLIAYSYLQHPGGKAVLFLPDEVAHYRVEGDPTNPFRGVSWVSTILSDATADKKMTGYKTALLDNSAVPGMVLKAEAGVSDEQFDAAQEVLRARHTGWDKVGKTLLLGAGFDVKAVGLDFSQLDMKSLQGAGETRIAAASGVPVPIVGFSEGLAGSSLNTGNYGAARRRFADMTMRPMWRAACSALSTLVDVPPGARLSFDESDVKALQEDVKDEADIRFQKAATIRQLIDAGVNPDAAFEFAQTGDETVLMGQHSGLYSVQLQEPGAQVQPTA